MNLQILVKRFGSFVAIKMKTKPRRKEVHTFSNSEALSQQLLFKVKIWSRLKIKDFLWIYRFISERGLEIYGHFKVHESRAEDFKNRQK